MSTAHRLHYSYEQYLGALRSSELRLERPPNDRESILNPGLIVEVTIPTDPLGGLIRCQCELFEPETAYWGCHRSGLQVGGR